MPEPITGEPGPSDANRKIEEGVKKSFDDVYTEILTTDQKEKDRQIKEQFENLRNYGLLTRDDVEEHFKPIVSEMHDKITKLEEQNLKLIEALSRDRARGRNSGATENTEVKKSAFDDWKRPFIDEIPRRH